jgi:hypothetical protein
MLICSCILSGCFHTTVAEVAATDIIWLARPKIFTDSTESLSTPALVGNKLNAINQMSAFLRMVQFCQMHQDQRKPSTMSIPDYSQVIPT